MSGPRKSGIRGREGQALAEFALILPVLFLLIAGIIEFGRAWNIKQAVTDAAREGARYAVVQNTFTPGDADPVIDKVKERLTLANITTTDPPTTITVTPEAYLKCPIGEMPAASGAQITVLVETKYRMAWVGAIMQWAGGSSTITISSNATMRNEC